MILVAVICVCLCVLCCGISFEYVFYVLLRQHCTVCGACFQQVRNERCSCLHVLTEDGLCLDRWPTVLHQFFFFVLRKGFLCWDTTSACVLLVFDKALPGTIF